MNLFIFSVKIGKITILTQKWHNFGNELDTFARGFPVVRELGHRL